MKSNVLKCFLTFATAGLLLTTVGCNSGGGGGGGGGNPPVSEPSVSFHYHRNDGDYTNWNLWLWEKNAEGAAYEFNGKDDWGAVATYPLSTWKDPVNNTLGFIVRKGEWSAKDVESDRYVDFKKFEMNDNVYNIYLRSGDPKIYADTSMTITPEIDSASFYSKKHITVYTSVEPETVVLKEDGKEVDIKLTCYPTRAEIYFKDSEKEIDFAKDYSVEVKFVGFDEKSTAPVLKTRLYNDENLAEYNYDGELGAIYTAEKTTFKVWSPFSSLIELRIYETGTPKSLGGSDVPYKVVDMAKGEKGVWSAEVSGDLEGKYYTYAVTNSSYSAQEIVDPYARSCGVNGLRGMIVDFSKTNPTGWEDVNYLAYDRKELTVYETHVADVTSSKSWTGTEANRKLFKGMYEAGTTYTEGDVTVKTGFDHIKELGVNAVQIIPIFDQANDEQNMTFNWGYNPLNYNALEGGYSSNPEDGYVRIREFKELVKAYNEAGITIIMDVVYNHVNGAQGSNFDVLFPGYYFRYDGSGQLTNGSGCGNETASNHYMMRKFMVDSVKFWTEEYKLGGFRFDLMGLHDLDTMAEIVREAKTINEHVVIYGEPWTGGTSTGDYSSAKQSNGNKWQGYGAFNDKIRDALIKGGLAADSELGWVSDKENRLSTPDVNCLLSGIRGVTEGDVTIEDPDKAVTYVTCHDNYTLYDRMIATKKFTKDDEEEIKKINVLANSVIFSSQGTAFMLAGEEFLRTKNGSKNSYNLSYQDNELDYALKIKHPDMFENYQKMIAFKQNTDGLHLDKDGIADFKPTMSPEGAVINYNVKDTANSREYLVIHANGLLNTDTFDLSGYELYWSTTEGMNKELTTHTRIGHYETLIVYRTSN